MNRKDETKPNTARAVELWMISEFAVGAAIAAFMSLLVPPFVLQVTGSALRSGIVLAIVGLAAMSSPLWGRLADRRGAHRPIFLLSMVGITLSFLILALDAGIDWYSPIFGILLGLSVAAQGAISPAFIVGVGLSKQMENRQITASTLALPLGQVAGAAAVALGQLAGLTYIGLFWLATGILALCTVCTWAGLRKPVQRLQAARDRRRAPGEAGEGPTKASFRAAMASVFGMFLLVVVASSFSNNGMTSQIANIMPQVFGFTNTQTSALIALAGLLGLGTILMFGRLMARVGPERVFFIGTAVRLAGVLMMALVGTLGGRGTPLLAVIAMQLAYQGAPISRLPTPQLAARLAPMGAAEANGYYNGASALGSFLGCLAVGFAADVAGFGAVSWVAAGAGAVAMGLLWAWRRSPVPAKKEGRA